MERGDDLDLAETSRFGHSISGEAGRCLLSDNKAGLPGHAGFGRDQGRDLGIVEADLQRAFAQSHAAHRDRQRLTANARFPQKPSHFPHDIVADCDSTN